MATSRAHPTKVHSKRGKGENLPVIRDVLEEANHRFEQMDEHGQAIKRMSKDLKEAQQENQELRSQVKRLISYCKELDQRLEPGDKVYQTVGNRQRTKDLYQAGEMFRASRRLVRDGELMEGYSRASTQNEGSGGGVGATLVPTITYDAVTRIIGEASIPDRISLVLPMTSNKMVLPISATGPSVSYATGSGTNYPGEGNAPDEDAVPFTSKDLDTQTLLVLDTVSLELAEDSLVAIEPLLATIFGEAVALERNRQAFSSSNPFTGVVQTSGVGYYYLGNSGSSGKTTFASVTHSDLVGAMSQVSAKLIHRGVWIMHPNAFSAIVAIKDGNGRPIFATNWAGGNMPGYHTDGSTPDIQAAIPATLLARPCFLTESMPSGAFSAGADKAFAIYGDFRYHAFGLRKELAIEWNDSVFFASGKSAVRLRHRFAMNVLIPGAFSLLKTSPA